MKKRIIALFVIAVLAAAGAWLYRHFTESAGPKDTRMTHKQVAISICSDATSAAYKVFREYFNAGALPDGRPVYAPSSNKVYPSKKCSFPPYVHHIPQMSAHNDQLYGKRPNYEQYLDESLNIPIPRIDVSIAGGTGKFNVSIIVNDGRCFRWDFDNQNVSFAEPTGNGQYMNISLKSLPQQSPPWPNFGSCPGQPSVTPINAVPGYKGDGHSWNTPS